VSTSRKTHQKSNVPLRDTVLFNPDWDRISSSQSSKHTSWKSALRDDRDRSDKPYYCPVGWKRLSIRVKNAESGQDFYERFEGWSIAYHGTQFKFGLSILLSGLVVSSEGDHGKGVYMSPSVIYAAHPMYSEIIPIKESDRKYFGKTGDANFIQMVLELRVHPNSISKIGAETLNFQSKSSVPLLGYLFEDKIDPNFYNTELEWLVNEQGTEFFDFDAPNAKIVCTGLMIRTTDKHPALLDDSKWWWNVPCRNWWSYPNIQNDKANNLKSTPVLD